MTRKQFLFNIFILSLLVFISCDKDDNTSPVGSGIFSSQDGTTAIMNGTISSDTPQHWNNFIQAFPNTKTIIMQNCPGSMDDEANLRVARTVRQANVTIHLPANAKIASGAVDFYFAGTTRTREKGSKIGVHSWST